MKLIKLLPFFSFVLLALTCHDVHGQSRFEHSYDLLGQSAPMVETVKQHANADGIFNILSYERVPYQNEQVSGYRSKRMFLTTVNPYGDHITSLSYSHLDVHGNLSSYDSWLEIPFVIHPSNHMYFLNSFNSGRNFFITKTDEDGTLIWAKDYYFTILSTVQQFGSDLQMIVCNDGSLLIAGSYYQLEAPIRNHDVYFLLKLNEDGNVVWFKNYEVHSPQGENQTGVKKVIEKPQGGFWILGGSIRSVNQSLESHPVVFSVDHVGLIDFFVKYSEKMDPYDMALDPQNNLMIVGEKTNTSSYSTSLGLLVIGHAFGNPVLSYSYDPLYSNNTSFYTTLTDVSILELAGMTFAISYVVTKDCYPSDSKLSLMKVHANGQPISRVRYPLTSGATRPIRCLDQQIAIAETKQAPGCGKTKHLYLTKTNQMLKTDCSDTAIPLPTPIQGNMSSDDLDFDYFPSPVIYIRDADMLIDVVSVEEQQICYNNSSSRTLESRDEMNHSPILFPNPSQGKSTIDLGDWTDEESTIRIFDLTGRLIQERILPIENQKYKLSVSTPAMYLLQVSSAGKMWQKKWLIQ
ncbi:MAG: T9SS type A sorting domain-containing protein [Bacteroidota bacterium]